MDEVNGVIIGGDYVSWQLFYDGRKQSARMYAANDEDAKGKAHEMVKRLKQEYGGWPCYLYRDDNKWEIRIY